MRTLFQLALIFLPLLTLAQSQQVNGRVTSTTSPDGLPGVNVSVKGTTVGTITAIDGSYSIEIQPGSTLVFSFVGHKTQEIVVPAEQKILDIILQEEPKELSEVIVVGYYSVEKRDVTGAVTTVKADAFKDLSINGMDQALQGQAPGVQVTQSSGTPGGGISVRIRGATSIGASNRPLFIVDGVPVEMGALSGRSFGGQNDNALALINPNDIESMQVLKDASLKALYGSRASNGVVYITTKSGRKDATSINFDVQHGIISPVNKLDLLGSGELLDLQREAVTNAGFNPDAFGLIPGVNDAVNTDWQDAVLRTATLRQYQLSINGGDEQTTYYLSANYRNEEGIQLNNGFERMGLTSKLDRRISDKLRIGTNIIVSRALNKRVKGDNFLDGVYSGAIKSLPYFVPYDENGRIVGPSSPLYAGFPNFNPVGQAVIPRFEAKTVKLLGSISTSYQINDEITFNAQASIDYNNVTEDQYESSQTAIGGFLPSVGGQGYGVFIVQSLGTFIANARLNGTKVLHEKHRISGVLGSEILRNYADGGSVQGRLFASDDFTYIQSAGIVDDGSSFKSPPHTILSFFGHANYDFDDRLLITVGLRADGSSNFGPKNKFGYFPSISAGWRISNEQFFKIDFIDDLKIRTSYGLTGNERIPSFRFLGTWGTSTYNGGTGVGPASIANPRVKWESTQEINLGIDLSILEGRIQTSFDAYYNKTSDLLLTNPLPNSTGFGGFQDNIGDMENRGIELSINSVNINREIRWSSTLNLSKNINKVLYLADSIPLYSGYSAEGVDATNIVRVGEPLGSFWGLNFLGVNPATGDAIYEDLNGDGLITNADAKVIGNAQPKLIGGITNTVNYKNFDLSLFFQFSYGNKVLNFSKSSLVNMGGDIDTNQLTEALRRWQRPGDITDIPRYEFGSTFNNLHSNRLLEDASYLRLKNLTFGYNLPNKLVNKYMFNNVRVYATATNLWTLTKYTGSDPEVSTLDGSTASQGIDFFTLPQVRTISFGINATLR